MIGRKLTASANDSNQTEDESEDPARAATKAMTSADEDCCRKRREEDEELQDRNTASGVELHCGELEGIVFGG